MNLSNSWIIFLRNKIIDLAHMAYSILLNKSVGVLMVAVVTIGKLGWSNKSNHSVSLPPGAQDPFSVRISFCTQE